MIWPPQKSDEHHGQCYICWMNERALDEPLQLGQVTKETKKKTTEQQKMTTDILLNLIVDLHEVKRKKTIFMVVFSFDFHLSCSVSYFCVGSWSFASLHPLCLLGHFIQCNLHSFARVDFLSQPHCHSLLLASNYVKVAAYLEMTLFSIYAWNILFFASHKIAIAHSM